MVLLFRQKDPKPFSSVRGPTGKLRPGAELNGSETRFAQTVLARAVEFDTAAPPRPKAELCEPILFLTPQESQKKSVPKSTSRYNKKAQWNEGR